MTKPSTPLPHSPPADNAPALTPEQCFRLEFDDTCKTAGHSFFDIGESVRRGASLEEAHRAASEWRAGINIMLEQLEKWVGPLPPEGPPNAGQRIPRLVDVPTGFPESYPLVTADDEPEQVRQWRHAVFVCVMAARTLATFDLGKFIQQGTQAETMGPLLDPTLYIRKGQALREDIQTFAAALEFVGRVKLQRTTPAATDKEEETS